MKFLTSKKAKILNIMAILKLIDKLALNILAELFEIIL